VFADDAGEARIMSTENAGKQFLKAVRYRVQNFHNILSRMKLLSECECRGTSAALIRSYIEKKPINTAPEVVVSLADDGIGAWPVKHTVSPLLVNAKTDS
jgi:hypothetical protein